MKQTEITKTIKRALIDRGMTVADLSRQIGRSYTATSLIINCRRDWEPGRKAVSRAIGIPHEQLWR